MHRIFHFFWQDQQRYMLTIFKAFSKSIMICGMDNLFVLCWFLTNNAQYMMMVLLLCAGDNGVNVMMMMISVLHQMWSWHFPDRFLHSMSHPRPHLGRMIQPKSVQWLMDNLTSYKNNHLWSLSDPGHHNTPPTAFITPQESSWLERAKKILQTKTKQFKPDLNIST